MQLTVRDVSRFLNVSESTVTRWIKQRGLPCPAVRRPVPLQPGRIAGVGHGQPDQGLRGDVRPPGGGRRAGPEPGGGPGSRRDLLSASGHQQGPRVAGAWSRSCRFRTASTASCSCGCSWPGRRRRPRRSATASPLPHVRNPIVLHVDRPMVTLCFLERPVDFGALDGKPVHVLFSLICPTMRSHLQTAVAAVVCLARREASRKS